MSVKLYVGGKSAYTFLSTQSAEEFLESQSEAVRSAWPMEVRITRDRKAPDDNGPRQEQAAEALSTEGNGGAHR